MPCLPGILLRGPAREVFRPGEEGGRRIFSRDPPPLGPGRLAMWALGKLTPAHSLCMAYTDERDVTAARAPRTLQRN